MAKNQSAAKPRTRTAKTAPATSGAAAKAGEKADTVDVTKATAATQAEAEAEKPVQPSQKAEANGNRLTVTIPLDGAVVGTAVKVATLPLTAAKKVAQNKNGVPAYVAVGGLAVLGAVEWPVAAVGGLGLAVLRRWGPLKPEKEQEQRKEKEKSA